MQHCNQWVESVPSVSKGYSPFLRFARASLGLRVNGRIANIYSVHASLRLSLALLGQVSGSESKSQSLNHIERTKQALKH